MSASAVRVGTFSTSCLERAYSNASGCRAFFLNRFNIHKSPGLSPYAWNLSFSVASLRLGHFILSLKNSLPYCLRTVHSKGGLWCSGGPGLEFQFQFL